MSIHRWQIRSLCPWVAGLPKAAYSHDCTYVLITDRNLLLAVACRAQLCALVQAPSKLWAAAWKSRGSDVTRQLVIGEIVGCLFLNLTVFPVRACILNVFLYWITQENRRLIKRDNAINDIGYFLYFSILFFKKSRSHFNQYLLETCTQIDTSSILLRQINKPEKKTTVELFLVKVYRTPRKCTHFLKNA